MMKVPLLFRSCATLGTRDAGEDAASIDWGVNTCAKSTNQEHAMVAKASDEAGDEASDEASDKGGAGRLNQYRGKDLSAARAARRTQRLVRSRPEPLHGSGSARRNDLQTGVGSHKSPQAIKPMVRGTRGGCSRARSGCRLRLQRAAQHG